jgi:hypothetical protein
MMKDIRYEPVLIVVLALKSPSPIFTVKIWQVPVLEAQAKKHPGELSAIGYKLSDVITAAFLPRYTA